MSNTSAQNPYAAPTSNLHEVEQSEVPSIDEALRRKYDFDISLLIKQAWILVKGTKGIFFGGLLIYQIVVYILNMLLTVILGALGIGSSSISGMFAMAMGISIACSILTYPFIAGINMVGIRRAAGQPISFNEIFAYFGRFIPIVITGFLIILLTTIGTLLLLVPGIYLSVAYLLAVPLVVERGLSPWQALEASRKAIHQHWFKTFGLLLLLGLIQVATLFTLGIGMIWTIPLFIIAIGLLYRTIFGVLPPPAA